MPGRTDDLQVRLMTADQPSAPSDVLPPDRRTLRRLMLFFGIVYVVEGLGQTGGLISQPLTYFLKEFHGWTPIQVTAFLTLFNLPWVIKPLYGVVSDFIPLFGYRRKSYLVIANVLAIGAFLWVAQTTDPGQLAFGLLLTGTSQNNGRSTRTRGAASPSGSLQSSSRQLPSKTLTIQSRRRSFFTARSPMASQIAARGIGKSWMLP